MQAVESETLILYHTDLRGEWPEGPARSLAARLPYARRLAVGSGSAAARASLAGIALALRALAALLARHVSAGELVLTPGLKPRLAQPLLRQPARGSAEVPARRVAAVPAAVPELPADAAGIAPDFSISHSGPWVGCAALARGRVGLDIEMGTDARIADWVVREATLKATGAGLRAVRELGELRLQEDGVRWRGERWHVRRLDLFPGASACVLSSRALQSLEVRALTLAELFHP